MAAGKSYIVFLFLLVLGCMPVVAAPRVQVGVNPDNGEAYLGESFIYQIQVHEAEDIQVPPELQGGEDFLVSAQAPGTSSSSQVSIINGRVTRTETKTVTYYFTITPKRLGHLVIPSVKLRADGQSFATKPYQVRVLQGEKYDDIYLEIQLSDAVCRVGQPVMAVWRWHIGRTVGTFSFDLPLLSMDGMEYPAFSEEIDNGRQENYRRIPVADGSSLIGELKRTGGRNGELVLEFRKPFIPMNSGVFKISAGTVSFQVESMQRRRRSMWDSWMDFPSMKTVTKEGNTVELRVEDLPNEGQPADFSGIIGKCRVSASVNLHEVNVGDPMVLTLTLSGLPFPDAARIPGFARMEELAASFRISDEDGGIVKDDTKQFQCTVRAKHDKVTEIPSLKISYFDTVLGKYETASTEPIALKVHPTRQITALDAQGTSAGVQASSGDEVKSIDDGIAHNYSWDKVLGNKRSGFRSWKVRDWRTLLCGGLLAAYLLLLSAVKYAEHRNANPAELEFRKLASGAKSVITSSTADTRELHEAFRDFLRGKLKLPPGAVTYRDIGGLLEKKGISAEDRNAVDKLMEKFEAASYSGGGFDPGLKSEAARMVKLLDKKLR